MARQNGRPRILVCDSDEDMLRRIAQRLGAAGYEVLAAPDGTAALACLHDGAAVPDACVLDALLPLMTGYDVLRHLRADPATRALPVLLLTALPIEAGAFDSGADAYLRKPFSPNDLPGRIAELLAARTPADAPADVSARRAQKAPRRIATAGTVFRRITRSSATDHRSR